MEKDLSSSSDLLLLPRPLRIFSTVTYLLLLLALACLVLVGPVEKFLRDDTKFKQDFADPAELPAPTISVCKLGARQENMYLHACCERLQ